MAMRTPPHRRHVETETRDVQATPEAIVPGRADFQATIRGYVKATHVAPGWRADTHILPAFEPRMIAGAVRQRKTLHVWTDPANTGPVWVSPAPITSDPAGANRSGAVPLTSALDFTHTGPVYAWSANAGARVYVTAEFLAYDESGLHASDDDA